MRLSFQRVATIACLNRFSSPSSTVIAFDAKSCGGGRGGGRRW